MYRQNEYFKMLKSTEDLLKDGEKKTGKTIEMERVGLEMMRTCLHKNLVSTGAKYDYHATDDTFIVDWDDMAFSISGGDLRLVLPDDEYAVFFNEIREDGRVIGTVPETGREVVVPEVQSLDFESAQYEEDSMEEITEEIEGLVMPAEVSEPEAVFLNRISDSTMKASTPVVEDLQPIFDREEEEIRKGFEGEGALPVKNTVTDKYTDTLKIDKNELLEYYAAFSVIINGQFSGRYELIAAPVDPSRPTGTFCYWVKKHKGNSVYVKLSSGEGKRHEEGSYMFYTGSKKYAARFIPELVDGEFSIRIETDPADNIEIEYKSRKTLGKKGHIIMLDPETDTAVHIIPVDFTNNDENFAGYMSVVENNSMKVRYIQDGTGKVDTGVDNLIVSIRWNNETLYSTAG